MNNPEQVANSFIQAYYQAFVGNRTGIAAFYVQLYNPYISLIQFSVFNSTRALLSPWKEMPSIVFVNFLNIYLLLFVESSNWQYPTRGHDL
jgi:hypothetical protein